MSIETAAAQPRPKPQTVETNRLRANPHNPRMLFDEDPMETLKESIAKVGILVPLTVYRAEGSPNFTILDGQRRWTCATALGMPEVPINEVPEPSLTENIVTMFQIHKLRKDWELMPTALKLGVLMDRLDERRDNVLDSVILLSEDDILQGYKGTLESLPGWSKKSDERIGRWFFVGMGDAGESGQAMLRLFREANGLAAYRWQTFCVMPRELPGLALKAVDSVVFVDDFAGSGQQMIDYWPIIEELVASEARCYLALSATTTRAEAEIRAKTEFDVRAPVILQEKDNLFSEECLIFTAEEKLVLERYGKRASKSQPRGFGDCGLSIVLSHKTPNNSVPILHANHANWISPFPRQLIPVAA